MSYSKLRKLNIQLLILTLCIAVPVLALISYAGIRSNQAQLNELLMEEQTSVQSSIYQIDSLLEMLENSLAYLAAEDMQIRSIAAARTQDTGFWMDNNAVLQKLKNQTVVNPLRFTTFIYYPGQDIFYNSETDPAFTQKLQQIMEEPDFRNRSGDWKTTECGEKHYLYLLLDYENFVIGAFAAFGSFYGGLTPSAGELFFYTDPGGTLLSEGQYENDKYQVSAASMQAPFVLVKQISKERIDTRLTSVFIYVVIVACVFAMLLIAYIVFLNIWILKPAKHLRQSMEIIQRGDLDHRIPALPHASVEFSSVIEEFNFLMDSIEQLKISIYEQELEQKEVRLEYLNRQIQPHFILNSLNTLYNFSEGDGQTIREMIRLISGYYRYVINVNSQYVELGQELDHIENYLQLQMLRYPGLFKYQIQCGKAYKQTLIPPFIIESFVGNSFKHGLIPGALNQISILTSMEESGWLCIRIEDSGEGFSDDSLDAARDFLEEHIVSEELGVGIRNSIERLQLIYKQDCSINLYNKEPHGAVVEIRIRKGKQDENTSPDH